MNFQAKGQHTPVDTPFRIQIPSGESSFVLHVPKVFRKNREFFFNYVEFYGDFFSKQAAELDLDIDDQLDEEITFDTHLYCTFLEDDTLYPNTFIPPNTITTTSDLASAYNTFFELNKQEGVISLGSFIDWTDERFLDQTEFNLEEWVEMMAMNYYDETYKPEKHAHRLPPSAEKIPGANSFLFPTVLTQDNLDNIGFRLNFAPNLSAYFSTDAHLKDMGFKSEQIGPRTGRNQFKMGNLNNEYYDSIFSEATIKDKLSAKASDFKVSLKLNTKNYLTSVTPIIMKRRDTFSIENYTKPINDMFTHMGEKTNFRMSLQFNETEKKFTFMFPTFEKFKFLTLVLEPDLSEKLGFGLITDINRQNATGNPVKDESDLTTAREKSSALGRDTGPVLITYDDNSSNTTSGTSYRTMAILYPSSHDGIMQLSSADVCNFPVTMRIPNFLTDSKEFVDLRFKLYRFLDNKTLVPLVWKCGAIIQGNFKGIEI